MNHKDIRKTDNITKLATQLANLLNSTARVVHNANDLDVLKFERSRSGRSESKLLALPQWLVTSVLPGFCPQPFHELLRFSFSLTLLSIQHFGPWLSDTPSELAAKRWFWIGPQVA